MHYVTYIIRNSLRLHKCLINMFTQFTFLKTAPERLSGFYLSPNLAGGWLHRKRYDDTCVKSSVQILMNTTFEYSRLAICL